MNLIRSHLSDSAAIRAVVDGWIIWRDSGDWARLLAAWHPGGRMSSTRFDGYAADFVADTKRAYAAGSRVRHTQSGFWCEVHGDRGFSVTTMAINQRTTLGRSPIDVTCNGVFVDFFAYRNGRWALERRQPAYDCDRIDPVVPGAVVELDAEKLAKFPPAYRHLAYVQAELGHTINLDLPETRGPSFDSLMAEAYAWLGAASPPSESSLPPPRRVVAAENAAGHSHVGWDDAIQLARTPVPGLQTRLVWATSDKPDYRVEPAGIPLPTGIAPPAGGSRFSILDIAPGHTSAALHQTDSVDYVICLWGCIDMLLDDQAVTLAAGDVAIQCGTRHGWANRTNAPARVAVILLDAHPKRASSVAGNDMAP